MDYGFIIRIILTIGWKDIVLSVINRVRKSRGRYYNRVCSSRQFCKHIPVKQYRYCYNHIGQTELILTFSFDRRLESLERQIYRVNIIIIICWLGRRKSKIGRF